MFFSNSAFCHGKGIMSSLEMIMAQDRTANNRQIRIGPKEIMWKLFYKIEQFTEGSTSQFSSVYARR